MKKQIYELSFWLRQGVENFDLKDLFKKYDFEIIKEIPLKLLKPAYPLDKETLAKFGTIYFYGFSDRIENFKFEVRKIKDILRFIILKRKAPKELSFSQNESK
jgi:ribosomal protein S6